jgi:uncharacterized protein with PIN domain
MKPRFLLDGMLGSLARWIRIIGYDAEYRRNTNDDNLIDEASNSNRILLTRDKALVKKAQKLGVESLCLTTRNKQKNLQLIVNNYKLKFDLSNSRCPKCNNILKKENKEFIKNKIPEKSYNAYNIFWYCNNCNSVYWRGTHWEKIQEFLLTIQDTK